MQSVAFNVYKNENETIWNELKYVQPLIDWEFLNLRPSSF